jgi:type 1 glutamine amidotransferase
MSKLRVLALAAIVACGCNAAASAAPLRVLIFSGQNNHNWKETTPAIQQILAESGKFSVEVSEHPEQATAASLAKFDVIVSNWNTFAPGGVKDWPAAARQAYVDFVRGGRGVVSVHAGSSSFYDWPDYQRIGGASWKLGQTSHGAPHAFTVTASAVDHPITRGMKPFTTTDELWVKPGVHADATVLATAEGQPSVLATSLGRGRGLTLLLGHDAKFMQNAGFRRLLLRGAEWAATGKVSEPQLSWQQTDGTLALVRDGKVVWQLNMAEREGKPYFHPLRLPDGADVTALRPADHPWHLGLWWSWKYIDGVNYWEFDPKTHLYHGITEVTGKQVAARPDHSATVNLQLAYHLPHQLPVLTERRVVTVSPPDGDGGYTIDWNATFTAGAKDAVLDRTPPTGRKNGLPWGGYAGLSLRFAPEQKKWTFTGPSGAKGVPALGTGKPGPWVDFSGPRGGVTIFDGPRNLRHPTPWYLIQQMPFMTPAILYHDPYTLPAGKTLSLRYRVFVHAAGADPATQWQKFSRQ